MSKSFQDLLKKIKAQNNFTIQELAKTIDVSYSMTCKVLNGDRQASKHVLRNFKKAFPNEIDLNDFI